MGFGDTELVREKGNVRILKVEHRNGEISYCVVGDGSTKYYDEYDDALEEFNLRWLKAEYGD